VPGAPEPVAYNAPYRHGIVITHIHNGNDRLVLVPRPGNEEWELWDCHWEGPDAHPSFAGFLQWFLDQPDPWPKAEDADTLIATFRAGRIWTLGDLAELGDNSRVFDIAREAIDSDKALQPVAQLLGHMGDPAAIPLLRELYAKTRGYARVQTLQALEEIGAEDLEAFLRDALTDPDDHVRNWASRRLAAHTNTSDRTSAI
jgi:hypothetical protein